MDQTQSNVSFVDSIQIMRSVFDNLDPSIKKFYLFNNDSGELIDLRTQKIVSNFKLSHFKAWDDFWKQQQLKTLEFFRYVRQGNLQAVVTLFSKYIIDVNARDSRDWTSLHYACSLGHEKIVNHLLQIGASADEPDIVSTTPLILAIKGQYVTIVNMLIKYVDVNKLDFDSNSPLKLANQLGQADIVNLLLKAGAKSSSCNSPTNSTQNLGDSRSSDFIEQSGSKIKSRQMIYMGSNIETSEFEIRLGRTSTGKWNCELNTDSFIYHKILGKGAFGIVYLVSDQRTNEKMALKVLDKAKLTDKMIGYMMSEKQVMLQINHPFLVKLRYAFQDDQHLFLVMNYFQGGDLGEVLQLKTTIPEEVVKIYAAEISLAIGELHKHNFIYRDLKPSNILVGSDGHCAITDFGLTKSLDESTKSFCGTPAYMAPEIVSHKSYNQSVDWYQLGAVVYEMLYGTPPYYSSDREELYDNIKGETLTFYNEIRVSAAGMNFIKELLNRNPKKRLGAIDDVNEVMKHPWLQDINLSQLITKSVELPPPILNTNSENIIYPKFFDGDNDKRQKMVRDWTMFGE